MVQLANCFAVGQQLVVVVRPGLEHKAFRDEFCSGRDRQIELKLIFRWVIFEIVFLLNLRGPREVNVVGGDLCVHAFARSLQMKVGQ